MMLWSLLFVSLMALEAYSSCLEQITDNNLTIRRDVLEGGNGPKLHQTGTERHGTGIANVMWEVNIRCKVWQCFDYEIKTGSSYEASENSTKTAVSGRWYLITNCGEREKDRQEYLSGKEGETGMMLLSLLFMSLMAHCTVNFTQWGETFQSSIYIDPDGDFYTPHRAVDGNTDTCAHTLDVLPSWWTIDLLGIYNISCISIFNKQHKYSDISGAHIYIGNSRENNFTANSMCRNITGFRTNDYIYYDFNTSGRYITVSSPTITFLVLCEVKIGGIKKASPFVLINENKTWEDALNHCRVHNMDLASILDEETQNFAELEVMKADSPFVWLGLRYTCTLEFWFWVDDHSLGYEHWATNQTRGDCGMSVAIETTGDHHWYSKSDNEMYNFICAR